MRSYRHVGMNFTRLFKLLMRGWQRSLKIARTGMSYRRRKRPRTVEELHRLDIMAIHGASGNNVADAEGRRIVWKT
jgi:hypothetical protein